MPVFVYKGEVTPIPIDGKTRMFFSSFMVIGFGLSVFSIYRLMSSFSILYVGSFFMGLLISAGYGWLWKLIQKQIFYPTLLEVHPSHIFLKKFNEQEKKYDEWTFPIGKIQIIIEKRLESYRETMYMTPALHLYDIKKKEAMELFFDDDHTVNTFLGAIEKVGGENRFLPYSLEYCTKEECLKAFQEESQRISFSGSISDYVPRNQEAFFYSERLEYKDLLLKRKNL